MKTGILALVQAPVGVALAAIFLDETVGPIQIAGGVAILVAAVLIQRGATPDGAFAEGSAATA